MASAAGVAATNPMSQTTTPSASQWPLRPVSLRLCPSRAKRARCVSMASAADVAATRRHHRTPRGRVVRLNGLCGRCRCDALAADNKALRESQWPLRPVSLRLRVRRGRTRVKKSLNGLHSQLTATHHITTNEQHVAVLTVSSTKPPIKFQKTLAPSLCASHAAMCCVSSGEAVSSTAISILVFLPGSIRPPMKRNPLHANPVAASAVRAE